MEKTKLQKVYKLTQKKRMLTSKGVERNGR